MHPEVESAITVTVARSADEAERIKRGEDISTRQEEQDEPPRRSPPPASSSIRRRSTTTSRRRLHLPRATSKPDRLARKYKARPDRPGFAFFGLANASLRNRNNRRACRRHRRQCGRRRDGRRLRRLRQHERRRIQWRNRHGRRSRRRRGLAVDGVADGATAAVVGAGVTAGTGSGRVPAALALLRRLRPLARFGLGRLSSRALRPHRPSQSPWAGSAGSVRAGSWPFLPCAFCFCLGSIGRLRRPARAHQVGAHRI